MKFSKITQLFNNGSVSVTGMKGTGKDVLIGNVIARRGKKYVSNLYYGYEHIPFNYDDIDLRCNYRDIVAGSVPPYVYPFGEGTDIYLSDVGVYFPSQYCNELNKQYSSLPIFIALSRQLGLANVHFNTQNLNRCWDKIREQSDIYIMCNWCIVLFGYVLQSVTLYDKAESCINRVKPCRITVPLFCSSSARSTYETYQDNFFNQHGSVKKRLLLYRNLSKHDTYYFKKFFANGGVKHEK